MYSDITSYGEAAKATIVLAHGAGAGKDSDFMVAFAEGLAADGFRCVLFDFPYMIRRQEDGKKRPPDRAPKLIEYYRTILQRLDVSGPLIIGGKSMGGRIASMLLAEEKIADGLVLLGYPFSPPGKPDNLRIEHFGSLIVPTLIIQGERDVFGGREMIEKLSLPKNIDIEWMLDGDHSFKPRKASGYSQLENWDKAIKLIVSSKVCDLS